MPIASRPSKNEIASTIACALSSYSKSLDATLDSLQTAISLPACDFVTQSLKAYYPGHPEELPIGRSWIQPLLSYGLIPKAARVLRLVLKPLSELVQANATHEIGCGLFLISDLVYNFYHGVQLLPIVSGSDAAASLLAQLSDEELLQSLADAAKIVDKVAWDMPVLEPAPDGPEADLPGQGVMTVHKRTARRVNQSGSLRSVEVNNTVTWGGRAYGGQIISRSSSTVMGLAYALYTASRTAVRDQAIQRLAATLERTQLLSVLCGALLRAPVVPFVNSATGALEATAVSFANALSTLSQSVTTMMSCASEADASTARPLLRLLAAPEVQRLLLAAVHRVVELTEAEVAEKQHAAAAATSTSPPASGSAGSGVADGDAPGGSTAGAGGATGSSALGPGGGWPLFDPAVASQIMPEKGLAAGLRRWDVVRSALVAWHAGPVLRLAPAVVPPPATLAPLLVRLNRALAASPPPVTPPARDMPAAAAATESAFGLLRITVMSYDALQEALESSWQEELLVAQLEVRAWGLAAASRRLSGLLAGPAAVGAEARAELESDSVSAFVTLLIHLCEQLLDKETGLAALSSAAQNDLVWRLGGAGLLRTWDTALRVTAFCRDWRLAPDVVMAVARMASVLMLPLLRIALRLVLPPGATSNTGPMLSLPPPAPPTDPWDAPRDLGWLVTAAKLLMRTGQHGSGSGSGDSAAASTQTRRLLRDALQAFGLDDTGLPTLRAELLAAAAAGGDAAASSGDVNCCNQMVTALMEAEGLCARTLGQAERCPAQLPPGVRRVWPPSVLRVCGNPGCGNLEGECEAALKLRACGGCKAYRYCGEACQRAHWRDGGHKAECAALAAALK